jgi:hypothetical protein
MLCGRSFLDLGPLQAPCGGPFLENRILISYRAVRDELDEAD